MSIVRREGVALAHSVNLEPALGSVTRSLKLVCCDVKVVSLRWQQRYIS
jgi:hypothetical protein